LKKKFISIFIALVLALSLCLVTAVPVSASPGGIELVAKGDSTAEWVTEQVKVGSYSAKLTLPTGTMPPGTKNAEVQIDVSDQNLKFSEISDWRFWTITPAGMEHYALPIEFYADLDGDGLADKIVAGNILKASVPVTDEWYEMTPELWDGGGCFYVWREDGTGFDWLSTWAKVVERWGDTTLVRVDLGYGHLGTTRAVTAYADDLTINDIVYELEPPPPIIEVNIDIKPGSDPNSINLKSKGVVPVAVLTAEDFDASTIDPATVEFAGASPVRSTLEDVGGDDNLDMLFHFKTQDLDLDEDSTEATLTGTTHDGQLIQGTDTVNIVPKGK